MLCIPQLGIYRVKIISVFLMQQLFLTNSLIFKKRCTRLLKSRWAFQFLPLGHHFAVECVSHVPYSCFGWRRELSGYVCFGFDLKVECLSYLMIRKNLKKNLAGYSAVRSTDEWISFLDVTNFDASFFWPHPLKRPDVHNSGSRLGTGHTAAENRIGTVLIFHLPEGYTEPGACNQIRYSSERYACH